MNDLFNEPAGKLTGYSAQDIEVLEGLEPVRRRPGMYVGGTDDRALHHLFAEVLDNAMDEAVAGHASRIEVELTAEGWLTVSDNGRGIPVDPHPKFKDKSALEVIMTTLHSGGKFSDKVYSTAGGLHGVGISVVNALSEQVVVEVARERVLWRQTFSRGVPQGKLEKVGPVANRRGTQLSFRPDPQIFGEAARFRCDRLYRMARSKAYLFPGVEIRWSCDPALPRAAETPAEAVLRFPGGLADFLAATTADRPQLLGQPFADRVTLDGREGRVEWAIAWLAEGDGSLSSYCNTVPTPEGGTHENGLRAALVKGLRAYGELTGQRKAAQISAEDVLGSAVALLSVFIREPQFQGQTKEKLANAEAARLVENAVRDHFEHWLSAAPDQAKDLMSWVLSNAEERLRRKQEREVNRRTATRKHRLPGKLADCSQTTAEGSELFIVEGDSAGGSAKQARNRNFQAVLPLRGKILNVASANAGKMSANQELSDLIQALGCRPGQAYREEDLRYDKVIIMTDADVDGAHIASLLMTYFFTQIPNLVRQGHLYLALPPLYRLSAGGTVVYARDDAHRDEHLKTTFKGKQKVDISRFKGLGEMPVGQLKETTMDRSKRVLLQVQVAEEANGSTARIVEELMGRRPELRYRFIQDNAAFVDTAAIDV
ncbi:MAG: DNA topoisomerase IV subunit B [Sneathiellaceae bacterium]